jgi:Zn-dependent protease
MNLFIQQAWTAPFDFFSWVLVVMFSICMHEYAHAATALRFGDDTAARAGHLSLNPLVQMGPTSLLMLALAGIAWGAVPVNPRLHRRRSDAARVAVSGPAANLALSAVFALALVLAIRLADPGRLPARVAQFLSLATEANAVLFVLNLLPLPMFDGWSVLALAWPAADRWLARAGGMAQWIALALLVATPAGDFV